MKRNHHAVPYLMSLMAAGWMLTAPARTVGQEIVPGWRLEVYAEVTDAVTIVYGGGDLYVGRDNSGSGGQPEDAVRIHRVSDFGDVVEEFGDSAIPGPGTVGYDAVGLFAGAPGAVVVAGRANDVGAVWTISPDGIVSTLMYLDPPLVDPAQLAFNAAGRLFMADRGAEGAGGALAASNDAGALVILDDVPFGATGVAVRNDGTVLCAGAEGLIRLYSAEGVLLDPAFADVGGASTLVSSGSGVFAAVESGRLVWILSSGETREVASGLPDPLRGIGGNGSMYLSDFSGDRVWRMKRCYSNCVSDGQLDLFDFFCFVNKFNAGDPYANCNGGDDLDLFDFLCFIGDYNVGC